jgi:hypothetical protein
MPGAWISVNQRLPAAFVQSVDALVPTPGTATILDFVSLICLTATVYNYTEWNVHGVDLLVAKEGAQRTLRGGTATFRPWHRDQQQ